MATEAVVKAAMGGMAGATVEAVMEVVAAEAVAEAVVEAVAEVVAAEATEEAVAEVVAAKAMVQAVAEVVAEAVMVAAAEVEQLMSLKTRGANAIFKILCFYSV